MNQDPMTLPGLSDEGEAVTAAVHDSPLADSTPPAGRAAGTA